MSLLNDWIVKDRLLTEISVICDLSLSIVTISLEDRSLAELEGIKSLSLKGYAFENCIKLSNVGRYIP